MSDCESEIAALKLEKTRLSLDVEAGRIVERNLRVIIGSREHDVAELKRTNTRHGVELASARGALKVAQARIGEVVAERDEALRLNTPLKEALGGGVVLSAKDGHFEAMASCPACGHAGHPHGWAPGRCAQADCPCVVVHVLVARMPAVTGTPSDNPSLRNLPHDPNGKPWIGYCDLCNGQHCVVVLDPAANVERSPHRSLPGGQAMTTTKHDHSKASAAVADASYYEAGPTFSVWSWSPAPAGTPNAKSTQVHLHFGEPPGTVMVVRFKGPRSLDALIAALQEHRANVWGKP